MTDRDTENFMAEIEREGERLAHNIENNTKLEPNNLVAAARAIRAAIQFAQQARPKERKN